VIGNSQAGVSPKSHDWIEKALLGRFFETAGDESESRVGWFFLPKSRS
jgi:hypothetical protein